MISLYDKRADEHNKTGFLQKDDWAALCRVIKKYDCKKIMEFGTGTSTRLFADCGIDCVSYEQDKNILKKIKNDCPDSKIYLWDGRPTKDSIMREKYDLIFVDAPWCIPRTIFKSRIIAFQVAFSLNPRFVALHDMHFKSERRLRDTIFKNWPQIDQSELTHICRRPK